MFQSDGWRIATEILRKRAQLAGGDKRIAFGQKFSRDPVRPAKP